MDARDYTERYIRRFQHYDQESKSQFSLPRVRIEQYRELLEKSLPRTLLFLAGRQCPRCSSERE